MMNLKRLLILLLLFCCISCDISKPFAINGKKEHTISSECGVMKVWGFSFGVRTTIRFQFDGEFLVDTDSLKIKTLRNNEDIRNLCFWQKGEKLTSTKIRVKDGDILTLRFDSIYQQKYSIISLLPSEFIKCNDKPIITDTIDIQYLR